MSSGSFPASAFFIAAARYASLDLDLLRHSRRHFEQFVVEEGTSAFRGDGHAHLVREHERVVGKLGRHIDRQHGCRIVLDGRPQASTSDPRIRLRTCAATEPPVAIDNLQIGAIPFLEGEFRGGKKSFGKPGDVEPLGMAIGRQEAPDALGQSLERAR